MKKQLFVLVTTLMMVSSAHALFEVRAGYGLLTPADENTAVGNLTSMGGFNLDAIVEVPLLPFGFGLRYESLGSDLEVGGQEFSSTFERTSLIINYRIIDLFAFFGLIGTVGFVNDYSIDFPAPIGTQEADSSMTFSVGAEGGVSLGLFMVGAELGYLMAEVETNASQDIDLSGVYAKAFVGVGF